MKTTDNALSPVRPKVEKLRQQDACQQMFLFKMPPYSNILFRKPCDKLYAWLRYLSVVLTMKFVQRKNKK